jgi:hypothetical protein
LILETFKKYALKLSRDIALKTCLHPLLADKALASDRLISRLFLSRLFVNTLPFNNARTVRGIKFESEALEGDPYGVICAALVLGFSQLELDNVIGGLEKLLSADRDSSAGEVLRLNENKQLCAYPSWAIVLPWESRSISEKYKNYPKELLINRGNNGADLGQLTSDNITDFCYSRTGFESHIKQFQQLMSMLQNGVDIFSDLVNPPVAEIFQSQKGWFWMMGDEGNHRAYLAHAVKLPALKAKIINQVCLREIRNWYNVKNGLFSIEEAKSLFYAVSDGQARVRAMI